MSRYHTMKVLGGELGYVEYTKSKTGKRGRPAVKFVFTETGKKFMDNLRKRDARAAAKTKVAEPMEMAA